MAFKRRRLADRFSLGAGAVALGIAAAVGAAVGDGERIDRYWTSAIVEDGREARVTEVIDYDFGINDRRGIFRDVPGLNPEAPIAVQSPSAPDQYTIESLSSSTTRLRIGDRNQTISGRHRYRISYPIQLRFDGVRDEQPRISWNAVGDRWNVSVHNVEIHLAVDRELTDLLCFKGTLGTWGVCTATQPEPGHVVVTVDKLDALEGITVSAVPTTQLSAPPAIPESPSGIANDPGSGVLRPAAAASAAALLAAAAASIALRRAGREMVWAGGSADAAFGPQFNEDYPVREVDHAELSELASTEFAPPKNLTAWQGGVLYAERVEKDHQVAWLLERAIAGEVEVDGTDKNLSLRLLAVDSPEHHLLERMFGGRPVVNLGSYDRQFAAGWKHLNEQLDGWQSDSGYWDSSGDRRRKLARGTGGILLAIGAVIAFASSVAANRSGLEWLLGVGAGAAMAGAGWAMLVRSWELRVRTPEGSGLWILIESFRRFIHNSDAKHVDAAAKQGRLLDYTAWAVALGEVKQWSKAVAEAEAAGTVIAPQALYLSSVAPNLGSATTSSATAPSSTGGGGGGGGVGSGGGGGGGGSW